MQGMADDRDRRRIKTPPKGVEAQIARADSVGEQWDDVTGNTPVGIEPDTVETISKINRRVKATMATGQSTLDRVDDVRREMHSRIERLDGKVEELGAHVGDLRETTGTIVGKLDVLVDTLAEDRRERAQHSMAKFSAFTAEVEVNKTRAMTDIELQAEDKRDQIEARKGWRKLGESVVYKVIAGIGAVWAVVSVIWLRNC